MRLRALLRGGLLATATMWGPVEAAYGWVFHAAAILANVAGLTAAAVKASYRGLLGAMARHAGRAGELTGALGHFRKVTRSYWPGLFHCYELPDLPRTDNDLEQLFGATPLPRATCQRPEGGLTGAGGPGLGAIAGGGSDAAAGGGTW